jgi:hypothetical protein
MSASFKVPVGRPGLIHRRQRRADLSGTVNWGDGNSQPLSLVRPRLSTSLTFTSTVETCRTFTITDGFPANGNGQVNVTPDNPPAVAGGPDVSLIQGDTFSQSSSFTVDPSQAWAHGRLWR